MKLTEWKELTRLADGSALEIERVRLVDKDLTVEGRFTVPALATLPGDDQIFVAAFVRSHGSIKQMEKYFGVSYPTIKNRLNRIAALLPFVEVEPAAETLPRPSADDLLARLERGETSVPDVISELTRARDKE